MSKKLFALIAVLALLVGFLGYRAVSTQAKAEELNSAARSSIGPAEAKELGKASVQNVGSASQIKSFTNLSTRDVARAERMAAIRSWTNLSTGDVERAKLYSSLNDSARDLCLGPSIAHPFHARAGPREPC
jgi:hypothetical protein